MIPDQIKRRQASWCPFCKSPAGPDCPDVRLGLRGAAKAERRATKATIREEMEDPR